MRGKVADALGKLVIGHLAIVVDVDLHVLGHQASNAFHKVAGLVRNHVLDRLCAAFLPSRVHIGNEVLGQLVLAAFGATWSRFSASYKTGCVVCCD